MRTVTITVSEHIGQKTYEVINPHFAGEKEIKRSIEDHKAGKLVLWVRTSPIDGAEIFGTPTERNLPMFK